MTKHTPMPWTAEAEYENGNPTYIHKEGHAIADCSMGYGIEDDANAALIVHAVNNHEALVAALVRAREAVNAIVLSTHSISFDADLRAIDTALAGAGVTGDDVGGARE